MRKLLRSEKVLIGLAVVFFILVGYFVANARDIFGKKTGNTETGSTETKSTAEAVDDGTEKVKDAAAVHELLQAKGISGKNEVVSDQAGSFYYLGADGMPTGGFYTWEGKLCYFTANGELCPEEGWIRDGDDWYYVKADGTVFEHEIFTVDGKLYHAGAGGKLAGGLCRKDGKLYLFSEDGTGIEKTGWVDYQGKKYFVEQGSTVFTDGKQEIDGKLYWFDTRGELRTGKIPVDDMSFIYADETGEILRDQAFTLDEYTYHADAEGVVFVGTMYEKAQGYYSDTDYLILCNLSTQVTAVYQGKKGDWQLLREMTCSTGAPINPTPKGEYKTTVHTEHFNAYGVRAWYATGFIGGKYLFHSSPYESDSEPRVCTDDTMGVPSSHGCVRMRLEDAKWMYDLLPLRTKVVIF